MTKPLLYRYRAMVVFVVLSIIDVAEAISLKAVPFVLNSTRFIVVILYMAEARHHVRNILIMTKNSMLTIISLFCYCAIYSFIGYFVYKNSLGGYSFFETPSIAFYEMFVLVTT